MRKGTREEKRQISVPSPIECVMSDFACEMYLSVSEEKIEQIEKWMAVTTEKNLAELSFACRVYSKGSASVVKIIDCCF